MRLALSVNSPIVEKFDRRLLIMVRLNTVEAMHQDSTRSQRKLHSFKYLAKTSRISTSDTSMTLSFVPEMVKIINLVLIHAWKTRRLNISIVYHSLRRLISHSRKSSLVTLSSTTTKYLNLFLNGMQNVRLNVCLSV